MGIKAQAYAECSFCLWFSSYSSECTICTIIHFSNTNLRNHDYCNYPAHQNFDSFWFYLFLLKVHKWRHENLLISSFSHDNMLKVSHCKNFCFSKVVEPSLANFSISYSLKTQENSGFLGYETGGLARIGLRMWNVQSFYMNRIYREIFVLLQL